MTERSTAFLVRRLIAYQPLLYLANAICWILFHTWPLLPGLVARWFFAVLVRPEEPTWRVAGIAGLLAVLGLGRAGIVYVAALTGAPYRFRSRALLQRNLFVRILERPGAQPLPGSVGEALSTFRDDVEFSGEATDWLFDATAAALFAVLGLTVLLTVNVRLTLLVFLPMAVVIGLAHAVRVRLTGVRAESRAATARTTGAMGEIFGAVQAVWVAGAEERVIAHLRRLGAERQRAALRDRLQGLWLEGVFESVSSVGAGLVLLLAAEQMRTGTFTLGDFALFASYLMQVTSFTSFLGYLINTYRQAGVSFARMVQLLQGAPAERLVERPQALAAVVPDRGEPLEHLEVHQLRYLHPESGRGIQAASFSLTRGSLTVVTGRVGSGKTTLLRAVLGQLEPQAGEVRWNGKPVTEPAVFFTPPRAAYTPQVPGLLSGTLAENILLGIPADQAALEEACRLAVLERDLKEFPLGLKTEIGTRGMKLSGGQVQRVAAARMLVRRPDLLVFDDLSSALDPDTERTLWERLTASGYTCLVVSHRREALARADQILLVDDGRIIARGKLSELLASTPEMQRLWTGA